MILLSHPTADDAARHAARALNRAGVLSEFWTYSDEHNSPQPLAVAPDSDFETADPFASMWRGQRSLAIERSARGAALRTQGASFDAACRDLDRVVSSRLGSNGLRGVYAHEGGAEESFRAARERGLLCVYGVRAGHWQVAEALYAEEADREPEWAPTLAWPRPSPDIGQRQENELLQADLVIAASTFSLQTFECVPSLPASIAVLPPGFAWNTTPPPNASSGAGSSRMLRALFVGELGQRKGLSYLFRACRELRHAVSLSVIGNRPPVSCTALDRELRDIRWLPYESLDELQAEMTGHDVLLAPSLFDDFDPHLLHAMASGLPVIATAHTAAPDLVEDGVEGFIVPVRDSDALVAKLDLLCREPDRRAEMSLHARRRAQRHNWHRYEHALGACVTAALRQR